jgi:hypothetical protein
MNLSITFDPFLPWTVFWILCGLGLALAAFLLWKRVRGGLFRVLTYALLLLAIASPHLKQEEREQLTDIVAVVEDRSQSQRATGREPRMAQMRARIEAELKEAGGVETRFVESSGPGSQGERDGTALFGDLSRALADIPSDRLAGVIMLTDGQVHDAPAKGEQLGLAAPVHALIPGDQGEFDRKIEIVKAPRFGLVDTTQTVEVKVEESVARPDGGGAVNLVIKRSGVPDETRPVRVGDTVPIEVRIANAGPNIVELEAQVADGELTPVNNRAVLTIEGVRENLRVLLVSGEPHAGERTWRNLLKSDAAVDLVHFTILRPPEKQDGTPINELSLIAFPTRELFQDKLEDFDLIIFDRYQRRGVLPMLYIDNVARYVSKGGAVLVAAGEDYSSPFSLWRSPLAAVLPAEPTGRVVEEAFKPKMTELGEKHPVTRDLPGAQGDEPSWGRWFRVVDSEPVSGEVVMTGAQEKPLLVLGRRGEGRVALMLSDHAWLWARGFEGGGPHTDLLRRLSHWLMKEPDLEEEWLGASARGPSVTIERRSIRDEVSPVTVTAPSGAAQELALEPEDAGEWTRSFDAEEQGVYQFDSDGLKAVVNVGAVNPRELKDVVATRVPLDPALEATGGGAFFLGRDAGAELDMPRIALMRSGANMHGGDWMGLRKRDAYQVTGVRSTPLFSGALALALLLAAISLTWYREGR